jgi:hypothetical protein
MNEEAKTIKCVKEDIGENLCDIGIGTQFLDLTLKDL